MRSTAAASASPESKPRWLQAVKAPRAAAEAYHRHVNDAEERDPSPRTERTLEKSDHEALRAEFDELKARVALLRQRIEELERKM